MMPTETESYLSWGRYHRYRHFAVRPETVGAARAAAAGPGPVLAFGKGRSYGDTCLNEGGTLIDTAGLDHFLSFDRETGVLVCEAGVTLADILPLLDRPNDDGSFWFLPVTPGTKFVTLGGAVANDVHGKNHHRTGTFGCHVMWLDLARSDGSVTRCSPHENAELFRATIGGLGLTGLILTVAIQLMRVPNLSLEVEDIRMSGLDEFYDLSESSVAQWEYTAAWIDVLATGRSIGRGIFTRARHAQPGLGIDIRPDTGPPRLSVPFSAPSYSVNPLTLRAFNAAYSRKLLGQARRQGLSSYGPVFYPLDAIANWNRIYGRAGFFQYQCVVPTDQARAATEAMLREMARSRQGSFLVVLKTFGDIASPGLLSFPLAGTTLAVDFPNRSRRTLDLLERLDEVTLAAGGRVYAAKDGRMSGDRFRNYYPQLDRFAAHVDTNFSSSFWRRIGGAQAKGQDRFHP